MRILLISLFAIHGAMHLFGFFAAYEWVQISQLPYPIAHWQGLLWLSVAIAIFLGLASVWYGGKRWFVYLAKWIGTKLKNKMRKKTAVFSRIPASTYVADVITVRQT